MSPTDGETVRATIPHSRWTAQIAYPWPGTYRIQIASDAAFAQ